MHFILLCSAGIYGNYRMVRHTDSEGRVISVYRGDNDNKEPDYMKYGDFVPAPVKKGKTSLSQYYIYETFGFL